MTNDTDEQRCWRQWKGTKDPQAGDFLIKKYIPLVSYHVQRISTGLPKNVSKDDLKSLGLMGLLDALNKFDPTRDLKFDTYASFRVRGAIIDGLRKEDWLPRSARERAKKMEAKMIEMEQKLLRHVRPEEIANELGIPEEDVYSTLHEQFFASVLSIDEQIQKDDSESRTFVIQDEDTILPEDAMVKEEEIVELLNTIKQLTEKEQIVLSLFYKEELTLTEIGEVLSLSTSRISQIHSKAIVKLRKLIM
ncbi:FliA/WhiG family RNA polymerase sigma factor [Bacillus sp. 2205SS5-2]|uniref:FliA/WhiG family RNA polymerase sigma factor n=1 Tax=Bacillus sp. 2205SS5-2 TaxID=3109031 RepID=UPI0030055A3C